VGGHGSFLVVSTLGTIVPILGTSPYNHFLHWIR
jgi:hypothetical protein